jgi:hypothetical protein
MCEGAFPSGVGCRIIDQEQAHDHVQFPHGLDRFPQSGAHSGGAADLIGEGDLVARVACFKSSISDRSRTSKSAGIPRS